MKSWTNGTQSHDDDDDDDDGDDHYYDFQIMFISLSLLLESLPCESSILAFTCV